jgi:ATP-dependent DNA helicase RecQ
MNENAPTAKSRSPRQWLKERFGFEAFRPGQEAVITALLEGHSALAIFPTGSGKSLCYQLPALAFPGVTIVVSPLIALMKDQIDFLTRRGIPAARLDSSLTREETQAAEQGAQDGSLKLLYVSPERFNNERFLGMLKRIRISLFAIDEAHCISEWGHNFRPDYLKLAETAREVGVERVLCLTATATAKVAADICKAFAIAPENAIVTGFYRPNLLLATTPVTSERRIELLLSRLAKRPPGTTIVYVTLQKTAEQIARLLSERGFPAEAYHAGMDTEARTRIQEAWMASDAGIVVATIAFGMGIDKANVRYVYHYNIPKSLESHSQEIGRAGRDGQNSTVEMLCSPDDIPTLENFAYGDTPIPAAVKNMVDDLLSRGEHFDISLYELSQKHDLRPLVLRTALTYLELIGVLKQGTPRYAGYEFRPVGEHSAASIAAIFPGSAGELVQGLFQVAKMGRIWRSLNPDDAAETLQQDRGRIVRALEVMEQRGCIELRVSDARQVYHRLRPTEDASTLTEELMQRFTLRESGEIARLQQVLDLVTLDDCQVNALCAYFGEVRDTPCGHCTFCKTGRSQILPPPSVTVTPPDAATMAQITELRRQHPEALGHPRQMTRLLCGLSSPALTKNKLTKNPLFGAYEEAPFATVLDWC